MTVIFPYQGARGGFFHSSAALLPILWVAASIGLQGLLEWANRVRGWEIREARLIFSSALLVFALLLSAFTITTKVIVKNEGVSSWEENRQTYQSLEAELDNLGASAEEIVMTTDPPGYYAYTQRRAIAIPDGGIQTLLEATKRYGSNYLLLESNHPQGLNDLYANPSEEYPGLAYLKSVNGTHIFFIK